MGTPAASKSALAPGAGHGGEGDASLQGPAQEREEPLSAQPKSTYMPTNKPTIFETTPREAGLVMTRPKPEKRKNAKERAKDKVAKKSTEDGTRPMTATAKSKEQSKAKSKAENKANKRKVA